MQLSGLTEQQLQIINSIISGLIGAGGAMGVQWVSKKKSKEDEEEEHTDVITKASAENVKAAQVVVDMLKGMIDEQQEYIKSQIALAETSCNQKIDNIKELYDDRIKSILQDTEKLNVEVIKLRNENLDLSIQVASLTKDKETQATQIESQNMQITELKKRLSEYENGITGDHTNPIKKNK